MPTIPIDAIPQQLRLVWRANGLLQGADCTFLLNGAETGPVALKDAANNPILQAILGAELTAKIAENQSLTEQVASLPGLQLQISQLQGDKQALQNQLDALLNPPAPVYDWENIYLSFLTSQTYAALLPVAENSIRITLYSSILATAVLQGPLLPENAALAAFQASVTQLFGAVPLTQELRDELRALLDRYGFSAITLP